MDFIRDPRQIEERSMAIIDGLLTEKPWTPVEYLVIRRVVHTTGDPTIAGLIRFAPGAIDSGLQALRRGCTVLTDVNMVKAGINAAKVAACGGDIRCRISDSQVVAAARAGGQTRALTAIRLSAELLQGGVVAVGNAPTALFEVIRLVREAGVRPGLVIGTPGGFVGAAESKEELTALDVPYITVVGTRGGSTIAAATVNALLGMV